MIFSQEMKCDINRYSERETFQAMFYTVFTNPGARYMFLYRMCNKYRKYNLLGIIFRIWIKLLLDKRNTEIPHATKIQSGLYFGHFKNITINQQVIIGSNCNIMQGVTIGNESRGARKGTPVIGDRCLIGPNSVVVGNITIGDNVLIGPLTFVNFNVPSNSVVIGNPAKIISNNGSKGYINRTLNP